MATFEISLLPDTTDQFIDVVLSDNPYTLRVLWNETGGYFSLSIYERGGNVIVENIKMVKNYPLMGRYKNILLPEGDLIFLENKTTNNRPTYESIGTGQYSLLYSEPEISVVESVVVTAVPAVSGSIWDSGLTTWIDGMTESTWD